MDANQTKTTTQNTPIPREVSPFSPPPGFFPDQTQTISPNGQVIVQGPPSPFDRNYIPGFLASNIGKKVRAEFVIGTAQYIDKSGKLIDVGTNYFVLEDAGSQTFTMCDLYSVKFVTFAK